MNYDKELEQTWQDRNKTEEEILLQNQRDALQILINFLDKIVNDNPDFELAMFVYLQRKYNENPRFAREIRRRLRTYRVHVE